MLSCMLDVLGKWDIPVLGSHKIRTRYINMWVKWIWFTNNQSYLKEWVQLANGFFVGMEKKSCDLLRVGMVRGDICLKFCNY